MPAGSMMVLSADLTRDRCVYGRVYLSATSSKEIRGFSFHVVFVHSTEGSWSPPSQNVEAFSYSMPMFANVEGLACSVRSHSEVADVLMQDYGG